MAFEAARLTVSRPGPAPVEGLLVEAVVARPGRKVQLAEATVRHAGTGTELARARALRIRSLAVTLTDYIPGSPWSRRPNRGPPRRAPERSEFADDYVAFHNAGVEHRFAAGTWLDTGPVTVWIRLLALVLVEGGEGALAVAARRRGGRLLERRELGAAMGDPPVHGGVP